MEGDPRVDVSVVMPCLNEAVALGGCIERAQAAIKALGVRGEVVVSDNGSTDGSAGIAEAMGARVVHQPVRGYGAAYLAGIAASRGEYIVMADADGTYPFEDIEKFVAPLRDGYEFVIGSRFRGEILPGAMPWTHRRIGNPILSGILRWFFHTDISDAHCGMRATTREAYERMDLRTTGMEFASEMVVKAAQEGLRTCEVPITYRPREGESKLHPMRDAWRHMRFMLLLSPTHLFVLPGVILFLLGMLGMLFMLPGPLQVGGHAYDVHVMTLAAFATLLGYQVIVMGVCARAYATVSGLAKRDRLITGLYELFSLERGIALGAAMALCGVVMDARVAWVWIQNGYGALDEVRAALFALTCMVLGAQTVFSAFLLSLLAIPRHSTRPQSEG